MLQFYFSQLLLLKVFNFHALPAVVLVAMFYNLAKAQVVSDHIFETKFFERISVMHTFK